MSYRTESAKEEVQLVLAFIFVIVFIWATSWMLEEDRQAEIKEACSYNEQLEICVTLKQEK